MQIYDHREEEDNDWDYQGKRHNQCIHSESIASLCILAIFIIGVVVGCVKCL